MTYNNNNNNNEEEFCNIPGFVCLTPEEDEYNEDYYNNQGDEEIYNWIDDSECQENLATILPLNPEECIIDSENHILHMNGIQLFFEEIGILYDEPEPIDPSRDYEAEAKILIEERNKTRKHHIDLSPIPSLDHDTNTLSGNSSASSSCCDQSNNLLDIRSPLYLGLTASDDKYSNTTTTTATAYAYSSHVFNSTTRI